VGKKVGKKATFGAALISLALVGVLPFTGVGNASAAVPRPVLSPCTTPAGTGPVGSGPVGSGPVGSGPVGSGPVGSGPVRALTVYTAVIGNRQNGETICVAVGDKLLVSLSAPAGKALQWQHIVASPTGILIPAPMPVTLGRARTSTDFLARQQGRVKLSSQRRVCPPAAPGPVSCQALLSWEVTVVVRGSHQILPQPLRAQAQPISATA
jgi:hypothetical protein